MVGDGLEELPVEGEQACEVRTEEKAEEAGEDAAGDPESAQGSDPVAEEASQTQ